MRGREAGARGERRPGRMMQGRERERAKQKHLQPRWADRADTGTITSLLQILKRGKQTDKQHVPLLCVIMSLTETKPKCRRTKVAARCANQCTCNLSSANVSDSIKADSDVWKHRVKEIRLREAGSVVRLAISKQLLW